MSSNTVAEFASELKKSPDTLLEQLRSAGVDKSAASDALSENDKQKLLSFLQASHGTVAGERKKITLVKKSTSEIKQADATGKARTIQVEVRKKRTFIKRDDEAETTSTQATEPAAPLIDHAELARREEEARSQAELLRRQEEELAEKRRDREAKELAKREEAKAKQASEIDEAAEIDGASKWRTLMQVLIPLVRPGIVVAGIFAAIFIWNEFLVGMYVIDSESLKTVPIADAGLISAQRPIDWNVAATVGVVTLIPLLIGSMAIQKHIVQGITAGAVK